MCSQGLPRIQVFNLVRRGGSEGVCGNGSSQEVALSKRRKNLRFMVLPLMLKFIKTPRFDANCHSRSKCRSPSFGSTKTIQA
jgi:hypothetical protein